MRSIVVTAVTALALGGLVDAARAQQGDTAAPKQGDGMRMQGMKGMEPDMKGMDMSKMPGIRNGQMMDKTPKTPAPAGRDRPAAAPN